MIRWLQRLLMRTVAIAVILFGAVVAVVLAVITLVSGLIIGLGLTFAARLAARRRGRGFADHSAAPGSRPGEEPGRNVTVIDVEMREVPDAGSHADADAATPAADDRARSGRSASHDRSAPDPASADQVERPPPDRRH